MRLIIGLGNPGEKYANTRHNIGFRVLEKIAEKRGVVFRLESMYEARFAEMASLDESRRGELDDRIKLVQPQTFMNESGRAVSKIKNYWKVDSEDIWLIQDEVDLELGKVRIQLGGSSAGHKGVQSVIDNIGPQFWRIRIGVGKPASPSASDRPSRNGSQGGSESIPTDEWVLKEITKEESTKYEEIIDRVADFVIESLSKEIKETTINI